MNELVRAYSEEEYLRHRRNREIHDFRYIHWHTEAEKIRVSHEEWTQLIEMVEGKGRQLASPYKTRRLEWCYGCVYNVDDKTRKTAPAVYVSELIDGKFVYTVYYTQHDEEKLKVEGGAGHKGWNTLDDFVYNQYGVGLEKAFGVLPVEDKTISWITKCVKSVKYAFYVDRFVLNKSLKKIYKADISSAYPNNLRGPLPDANTAKKVAGRVVPTEEYPFAFYPESGHVAEYNKFDTHALHKTKWYKKIEDQNRENCIKRSETFTAFGAEEETYTVLMKAAHFTLDAAIQKMYWVKENAEDKKTRDWYKWLLNALIGFMSSEANNWQHYQGHLAAIVYCRQIARMIELAEALEKEKNCPIYFAIDCIVWIGGPSALTTTKKSLGAFVQEANDACGVVCGQGQYFLHDGKGNVLVEKHQGVPASIYKKYNITNEAEYVEKMGKGVQTIEVYNEKTHKYEYKEVLK